MLTDEAFQKLLFDLFCLWHDVQRHFDPPINSNEEEKLAKVRKLICKLLNEIDSRVKRIRATPPVDEQEFIEEWTNLTWNTLCITSRMQTNFTCPEDRVIYTKLNLSLIELVNNSRSTDVPPTLQLPNETLSKLSIKLTDSMEFLHQLYRQLKNSPQMTPEQTTEFDMQLRYFASHYLIPFIDFFKSFCNEQSTQLWADVRSAQVQHVVDRVPMAHAPVNRLVSFYSYMMHKLAVLGARLQGFRYELTTINKVFGEMDPVKELSDNVFTALELLMSDCILTTDPSTNTILVTNNLFSINCGALARGVVFKNFDVQLITEDTAEQIQSEMRRQKMLQQPSPIGVVPSAALLAMKPTSGTKRSNSTTTGPGADAQSSSAHKKSDVNSKETVTIYPIFNAKNRYWAATYPQLLCTTRQKGRQSTNSSFQDLSPSAINDPRSSGKRPIFYFYICATMFSPSGRFADAHTLSLPITIATRRNQDCQVQRMMSSYTATCFWLYGTNVQDGLLLQWSESGMSWDHFKSLFKNHFRVNAEIQRGLEDRDFELLQYKLQCNDCSGGSGNSRVNNAARVITFKNMLCPHLRYECGSTNVRFSVWRGLLEVLQIFQDQKTNVRKLWEKGLVLGFLEFDQVAAILSQFDSALIMRLSFITGGTICFTVKTNTHSLMHLEPLDLKKLQGKCLKDYLRDISVAEKVKYIINSNGERVLITDIIDELNDQTGFVDEMETGRSISSNVTHSGDIDSMQNITFTAMRIAVVTCKVKPPSSDMVDELQNGLATGIKVASPVPSVYPNGQLPPLPQSISNQQAVYKPQYNQQNESLGLRLPANATSDDFARELIQLCNFHGKSRNELMSLLNQVPENLFCIHSNYSSNMNVQPNYLQYSPPINTQMVNQAPIFQSNNLPNGANNRQKFSHSPSPMNTSPTGSSTLISSQPGSIMAPLSIGNMDPSLSMDQSTPPANTPNGFMTFGQL